MCWCVFQMLITPIYNPAQGQPLSVSPSIHRQVTTESPFFLPLHFSLSLLDECMHIHSHTHTLARTHACTHTLTLTLSLTHSWGGLWFLCLVSGVLGVMLKIAVRMTINPVAFHYFPFGFTRRPYQTYKKVLSPS